MGAGRNAVKLRITLEGINPAPWREIDVRLSSSLKTLHEAIQAAFLWQNSHLWEFQIGEKDYGTDFCVDEGDDIGRARTMRIAKIVDNNIKEFSYVYDYGDYWVHNIEILSLIHVEDNVRLPRVVAGERAAPPDDIGGAPGYEYFLEEILNNPKHPERENYEHFIDDPLVGTFNPEDMKSSIVNIMMKSVARAKPKSRAA